MKRWHANRRREEMRIENEDPEERNLSEPTRRNISRLFSAD
jgi:hypothetical protein